MKRTSIVFPLFVLLVSALLSSGCPILPGVGITASSPIATRDYPITDFTDIRAGSIYQLELRQSDTFSIAVTANENIFDYIDIYKSGSTLHLDVKPNISFQGPVTLKAGIGMPELRGVHLSGAAKADASGFRSMNDFNLQLSGASSFNMDLETGGFSCNISGAGKANGLLRASDTRIHLSGAAGLSLSGSGENASIEISGAGSADLQDFELKNVDIHASGGSRASVYAQQILNVNLSGGSSLVYGGDPSIGRVNVSGGASFHHK